MSKEKKPWSVEQAPVTGSVTNYWVLYCATLNMYYDRELTARGGTKSLIYLDKMFMGPKQQSLALYLIIELNNGTPLETLRQKLSKIKTEMLGSDCWT